MLFMYRILSLCAKLSRTVMYDWKMFAMREAAILCSWINLKLLNRSFIDSMRVKETGYVLWNSLAEWKQCCRQTALNRFQKFPPPEAFPFQNGSFSICLLLASTALYIPILQLHWAEVDYTSGSGWLSSQKKSELGCAHNKQAVILTLFVAVGGLLTPTIECCGLAIWHC